MGLISGLFGHASEVDPEDVKKEFAPLLVEGEELVAAYKIVRDMIVFTSKRLILVDKQGMTATKREYVTIPYASITKFSKESAGIMDYDAELRIWIRGQSEPITKEFKNNRYVNDVYKLLSRAVLE